jgi:hypothetical protein
MTIIHRIVERTKMMIVNINKIKENKKPVN